MVPENHLRKVTYSLAFLVKIVDGMLFTNIVVVKRTLKNSPDERPAIKQIKAYFIADSQELKQLTIVVGSHFLPVEFVLTYPKNA